MQPRVLLLEQDDLLADMLDTLLREQGCEVVPCRTLLDVWAEAGAGRSALAVLDASPARPFPPLDADRRQLDLLNACVPLVLLVDDPTRLREGSTFAVLPKPFDLDDMCLAVERARQRAFRSLLA